MDPKKKPPGTFHRFAKNTADSKKPMSARSGALMPPIHLSQNVRIHLGIRNKGLFKQKGTVEQYQHLKMQFLRCMPGSSNNKLWDQDIHLSFSEAGEKNLRWFEHDPMSEMSEQRYWGTQFHTLDSECTWGTDGCPSLSNLSVFLSNFSTNIGFNLEPKPKPFPLEPPSTNSNNSSNSCFWATVLVSSDASVGFKASTVISSLSSPRGWIPPSHPSWGFPDKMTAETCEPGRRDVLFDVPLIVGFYKMHAGSFSHMTGSFWCWK